MDDKDLRERLAIPLLSIGADCRKSCKVEYQDCMLCPICNKYLDQILSLIKEAGYLPVEPFQPEVLER